jgi:hypothetical protein
MGYGHYRTAYNLKHLAFQEKIIVINNYPGIPYKDRFLWQTSRKFYEVLSKSKNFSLIGPLLFSFFDHFQKTSDKGIFSGVRLNSFLTQILVKLGWGRNFVEKLKREKLPLISTFPIPAFMAEAFGYPGQIFCQICDTDIGRHWTPFRPEKSKIKYLATTKQAEESLRRYGVKPENIYLTGYPLPLEAIGGEEMEILKHDLKERILNLDPQGNFYHGNRGLIEETLGRLPEERNRVLTILFSVGGAGVQKEIGIELVQRLSSELQKRKIKIILSAGSRIEIKNFFLQELKKMKFEKFLESGLVEILFESDKEEYFRRFNAALRKTDILWTKPSELSFYAGLGLPIVITPPIGSHEEANKNWLLKQKVGIEEPDFKKLNLWFSDLLSSGQLAEMAFQGFKNIEKLGVLKIENLIS